MQNVQDTIKKQQSKYLRHKESKLTINKHL